MEVTEEMLEAAMKQAVEEGLIPRGSPLDTYLNNWAAMRRVLESVLAEV